ncbi:VCBS repeat-containing protein [Streptomyces sp. SJL17-4]|uniref:FG-GAP repeat domain-containing protein n=1 Tax=Streptomyces sp. SJL17-4 TaxID=2967224 RepID=UPI0030D0B8F9
MKHRISGRRLAAAVLTLSTVTAVTGTLVTAPAMAAPAAVAAGAQDAQDVVLTIPADAEIVSTGTQGFLTSRKDVSGETVLEWRKFDGSPVEVIPGTEALSSNSDVVVVRDGAQFSFRDMAAPSYSAWSINLVQVLGTTDYTFAGLTGTTIWATKPDGRGDPELHRITRLNGVLVNRMVTNYTGEKSYRVLAHSGADAFGLAHRGLGDHITYHRFLARLDANDQWQTRIDYAGYSGPGATAGITPKYMAWTEHPGSSTDIKWYDRENPSAGVRRLSQVAGQSTVIAGIVGDSVVYGERGGLTATQPDGKDALIGRSVSGAAYHLLDYFTSTTVAPDGSLLVRGGSVEEGDGLFRISDSGGTPVVTKVAGTDRPVGIQVVETSVPDVAQLDKNSGTVTLAWTLSRPNASIDLTFTHIYTGKKFTQRISAPTSGNRFSYTWNGLIGGVSAPNGSYAVNADVTSLNGFGHTSTGAYFDVRRAANPHDFNDNGSTDVLARDASGVLWRDDLLDWPTGTQVRTAQRTKVGPGWGTYKQIEAVGNIAGSATGDLVALDSTGVLWHYQGKGDGGFATRVRIGSGWGGYTRLTGGSDLNGDGRSDLLATDGAGSLWFYKGTGSTTAPFAGRVKVGGGWGAYNQLTAVGNIAGSAAGDLVARDTTGVLWLYQGNGAGNFATRVRIGSGWGGFSQLVGAGDVTNDGRPDLIAYGAGGTYVYRSTGSVTAPFVRMTTNLYAGEGTKFNSVA